MSSKLMLGVTAWILDKPRFLYGLAARLGNPPGDLTRLIAHYERWANVEVSAGSRDAAPIESERPRAA